MRDPDIRQAQGGACGKRAGGREGGKERRWEGKRLPAYLDSFFGLSSSGQFRQLSYDLLREKERVGEREEGGIQGDSG